MNSTIERVEQDRHNIIPVSNTKAPSESGLSRINGKDMFYQHVGNRDGPPVIFIHGLGGTSTYFSALVAKLENTHSLHLLDLEGHGLSPISALSSLTIASFAEDVYQMAQFASVSRDATVIAHSTGCLVAENMALRHPELVSKLILMGPPPSPLPEPASQAMHARATLVREKGMLGVVDAIIQADLSPHVRTNSPLAVAATRMSLLGQDAEGYAKGCTALARSAQLTLDFKQISCSVVIVTGDGDKLSPPDVWERYVADGRVTVLDNVGHWHLLEDTKGCVEAVFNGM